MLSDGRVHIRLALCPQGDPHPRHVFSWSVMDETGSAASPPVPGGGLVNHVVLQHTQRVYLKEQYALIAVSLSLSSRGCDQLVDFLNWTRGDSHTR